MKATDKEIVLNIISDLELTKDTQKMILCFDSETGNFEIKFE